MPPFKPESTNASTLRSRKQAAKQKKRAYNRERQRKYRAKKKAEAELAILNNQENLAPEAGTLSTISNSINVRPPAAAVNSLASTVAPPQQHAHLAQGLGPSTVRLEQLLASQQQQLHLLSSSLATQQVQIRNLEHLVSSAIATNRQPATAFAQATSPSTSSSSTATDNDGTDGTDE